MNRKLLKLK